jgi:hypothetical protein
VTAGATETETRRGTKTKGATKVSRKGQKPPPANKVIRIRMENRRTALILLQQLTADARIFTGCLQRKTPECDILISGRRIILPDIF